MDVWLFLKELIIAKKRYQAEKELYVKKAKIPRIYTLFPYVSQQQDQEQHENEDEDVSQNRETDQTTRRRRRRICLSISP